MKKHLLWTFCLLAVGFASCSDDDEKKTAPTPPGDQATTTPDVSQDLGNTIPGDLHQRKLGSIQLH